MNSRRLTAIQADAGFLRARFHADTLFMRGPIVVLSGLLPALNRSLSPL
jgi:hypothetical protein